MGAASSSRVRIGALLGCGLLAIALCSAAGLYGLARLNRSGDNPHASGTAPVTVSADAASGAVSISGVGDATAVVEASQMPAAPVLWRVRIEGSSGGYSVRADTGTVFPALLTGTVPRDGTAMFEPSSQEVPATTRLQIQAPGAWSVEFLPATAARNLQVPGAIRGTGDDVIRLPPGEARELVLTPDDPTDIAMLAQYTGQGLSPWTGPPGEATVGVDPQTSLVQVTALGGWTLEARP